MGTRPNASGTRIGRLGAERSQVQILSPRKVSRREAEVEPQKRTPDDLEARIRRIMRINGVGRHNAETLVRREMAREGA